MMRSGISPGLIFGLKAHKKTGYPLTVKRGDSGFLYVFNFFKLCFGVY